MRIVSAQRVTYVFHRKQKLCIILSFFRAMSLRSDTLCAVRPVGTPPLRATEGCRVPQKLVSFVYPLEPTTPQSRVALVLDGASPQTTSLNCASTCHGVADSRFQAAEQILATRDGHDRLPQAAIRGFLNEKLKLETHAEKDQVNSSVGHLRVRIVNSGRSGDVINV